MARVRRDEVWEGVAPARTIIRFKRLFRDGAIVEVVVHEVPGSVPGSLHGFKYRLVYVVDGARVIGFDNERGKGDHMHLHGVERPYGFTSIRALLEDFRQAIEKERGE